MLMPPLKRQLYATALDYLPVLATLFLFLSAILICLKRMYSHIRQQKDARAELVVPRSSFAESEEPTSQILVALPDFVMADHPTPSTLQNPNQQKELKAENMIIKKTESVVLTDQHPQRILKFIQHADTQSQKRMLERYTLIEKELCQDPQSFNINPFPNRKRKAEGTDEEGFTLRYSLPETDGKQSQNASTVTLRSKIDEERKVKDRAQVRLQAIESNRGKKLKHTHLAMENLQETRFEMSGYYPLASVWTDPPADHDAPANNVDENEAGHRNQVNLHLVQREMNVKVQDKDDQELKQQALIYKTLKKRKRKAEKQKRAVDAEKTRTMMSRLSCNFTGREIPHSFQQLYATSLNLISSRLFKDAIRQLSFLIEKVTCISLLEIITKLACHYHFLKLL